MYQSFFENVPTFLKSDRNPVYFIAEIGGNHEGDFKKALEQLDLALQAGVDAVKFQILRGDSLVSLKENPERNLHFKRFELKREQFEELASICTINKTAFLASVWNLESISWVDTLVPFHKIGSGDLTAFPIIKELVKTGKPILLSTGLSTLAEVRRTIDFIAACDPAYLEERKLVLLQCTSSYPNPDIDANLLVINTLREAFNLPVGYSDHTYGSEAAYIATLLGAQVLELHFTDRREEQTFRDHQISITYKEIQELMNRIQRAKTLLGSAEKRATPSELGSGHVKSFRRAVYAAKDLEAGQVLKAEDLAILRPEHGIPAWQFDRTVGCLLCKPRRQNDPIRAMDIIHIDG